MNITIEPRCRNCNNITLKEVVGQDNRITLVCEYCLARYYLQLLPLTFDDKQCEVLK